MELLAWLLVLLALVATIAVGAYISDSRGRNPVEGIALGCVLGPIGWVIALLLPDKRESWPSDSYRASVRTPSAVVLRATSIDPEAVRFVSPVSGGPTSPIDQLRSVALEEVARDLMVIEAVWFDAAHQGAGLAFGRPGRVYNRRWPELADVKADLFDATVLAPEPIGPAPAPDTRPTKRCPDCAETVLADARICRFCRHEFKSAG